MKKQSKRSERVVSIPPVRQQGDADWLLLFDDYFVRKQERSGTVVKLNQKHAPVEIIDLAQDARLFAEATATFVVAHWSLKFADPTHHRLIVFTNHLFSIPSVSGQPVINVLTDECSKH